MTKFHTAYTSFPRYICFQKTLPPKTQASPNQHKLPTITPIRPRKIMQMIRYKYPDNQLFLLTFPRNHTFALPPFLPQSFYSMCTSFSYHEPTKETTTKTSRPFHSPLTFYFTTSPRNILCVLPLYQQGLKQYVKYIIFCDMFLYGEMFLDAIIHCLAVWRISKIWKPVSKNFHKWRPAYKCFSPYRHTVETWRSLANVAWNHPESKI